MTISATATSKILPAGNDWRVVAADLIAILTLSVLAGGWGFSILTGWHPAITGLIVFALYALIYLAGRVEYINDIKDELTGIVVITIAEIVVFVGAAVITAIIWLLSLIPQYLFGWVLPFGPTLFVVWIIATSIFWLIEKFSPAPGEGDNDVIGFYDDH